MSADDKFIYIMKEEQCKVSLFSLFIGNAWIIRNSLVYKTCNCVYYIYWKCCKICIIDLIDYICFTTFISPSGLNINLVFVYSDRYHLFEFINYILFLSLK